MRASANSLGFPSRRGLSVLHTSAASGGGKPKNRIITNVRPVISFPLKDTETMC